MQPSVLTEVLLPAALALIMFGMGLTLTWDDFRRVVLFPKAAAVGLVAQCVFLPLLGWVLVKVLGLPYGLAAGLMILSLCPGGPTASLITFLAKGDAALSVTLTATSSLVTLVTPPLGLSLALENLGGQAERISLPVGQTVLFLFAITLVPTALGMAVKSRKPATATALETPFKLFGLVFLVLIILAAILKERNNIVGYFAQAGVAALLLNLLALALGAGMGWLFRLTKPQTVCVAIDTGNCNGTLSIAIAATILRQPDMAVTPAVYSLLMLVLGGAAVFVAPRLGRRIVPGQPLGARSLGDLLRKCAAQHGPKTAVVHYSRGEYREVSYDAFLERTRRYSKALRAQGLKRGDRLAILADNCVEWALADWGAQALGVVTVPIFPTLTADVVMHIVRDSGARLVLTGGREQDAKIDGVSTLRLTGDGSLTAIADSQEPMSRAEWDAETDACAPDDLATLIYTSGTTGTPKGVMLPHKAFIHVCDAVRQELALDRNEVFLSFLPMSHVYERIPGQVLPLSLGGTIAYSLAGPGDARAQADLHALRAEVLGGDHGARARERRENATARPLALQEGDPARRP
jgi:bile acid:Na+ symporter, BASS family